MNTEQVSKERERNPTCVGIYALSWALVNDRVKLLAYRILDPTQGE